MNKLDKSESFLFKRNTVEAAAYLDGHVVVCNASAEVEDDVHDEDEVVQAVESHP